MNNFIKLFFCGICIISTLNAQTSKDLKKKRLAIEKQILLTSQLLKKSKEAASLTSTELVLIEKNIEYRQENIQNIKLEINLVSSEVDKAEKELSLTSSSLDSLKVEYEKLIITAYKNIDEYDMLLFIFSAKDFNEAYNRMKYMEENVRIREAFSEKLSNSEKEYQIKLDALNKQLAIQKQLLAQQVIDQEELEKAKESKSEVLNELKNNETELLSNLNKINKEKRALSKAIENAIKKEIEAEKKKGGYEVTPAMKKLASDFKLNKGKLPWPVTRGVITGKFGTHPHPFLPNVQEENNGVDISTPAKSSVRTVFKGTVTAVIVVSGSGKSVIVSHGSYRTIYSNLLDVKVSKGDVLETNQIIGTVLTNPSSNKTAAHFEIWEINNNGIVKQNPELWLAKK